jgi:hypothetical protein
MQPEWAYKISQSIWTKKQQPMDIYPVDGYPNKDHEDNGIDTSSFTMFTCTMFSKVRQLIIKLQHKAYKDYVLMKQM